MSAPSLLNKLPCKVFRKMIQYLPRSDRTSLDMLISRGGYKEEFKECLGSAAESMADSVVRWEGASAVEETFQNKKSFILKSDSNSHMVILPGTMISNIRSRQPPYSAFHLILGRSNGLALNMKELAMLYCSTVEHAPCDLLVIYLKPEEDIIWRKCNASSIPGEALIVDRSWEGEPVFLGYTEVGERRVFGYVRPGKGLCMQQDYRGGGPYH